jgi:hypothetical protein
MYKSLDSVSSWSQEVNTFFVLNYPKRFCIRNVNRSKLISWWSIRTLFLLVTISCIFIKLLANIGSISCSYNKEGSPVLEKYFVFIIVHFSLHEIHLLELFQFIIMDINLICIWNIWLMLFDCMRLNFMFSVKSKCELN